MRDDRRTDGEPTGFYFIADLAEQDGDLQIMYGIGGERELTELTLDHLSGYEGARPGPVRKTPVPRHSIASLVGV